MVKRLTLGIALCFSVVVLLLLAKNLPDTLEAEPRAPHVMYGRITDSSGTPVSAGYTVQARINKIHYGQAVDPVNFSFTQNTVTHTLSGSNNYGVTTNFQVCADDPGTTMVEGGQGTDSSPVDSMSFYVNNMPATPVVGGSAVASVPFRVGGSDKVDLIIGNGSVSPSTNAFACKSLADPTPAPIFTGGGGGGGGAAPTAVVVGAAAMAAVAAVPLTAEDIQGLEAADAADSLKDTPVEEVVSLLNEITVAKAAEILELFTDDKAAAVIGSFETEKSATIIETLSTTKAAAVIGKLEVEKAIDIMEIVKIDTAVAVVEELSIEKAFTIVDGVTESKAVDIVDLLSVERATTILTSFITSKIEKAARILEKVKVTKAASILSAVEPKDAGKAFDALATKSAGNIIANMTEEKLTERIPEMTADKMFAIDPRILFQSMPNVPTEQLVGEVAPQPDADLPAPRVVQSTDSESIYLVERTKVGKWAGLVGSPAPIDKIVGKFNSALEGLNVVIESLLQPPSGAPSLSQDKTVYSIFGIQIEGMNPTDMGAAHSTIYIDKTWMAKNNIHKWSIQLNRLTEDTDSVYVDKTWNNWVPFSTKRLYETNERIYYSVVVPGFSTVSISGSESLPDKLFEVSQLRIRPVIPRVGEPVTISATVKNLTGVDRTYPGNLWLDGTIEQSSSFDIPASESSTITFSIDKPKGSYEVRVEQLTGNFSVASAQTATPVAVAAVAAPAAATATPAPVEIAAAPTKAPTAVPEVVVVAPTETPAPTATATQIPAPTALPPAAPTAEPKVPTATPVVTPLEPTATPVTLAPTPEAPEPVEEEGGGNMGLIIAIAVIALVVIGGGIGFMVVKNKG